MVREALIDRSQGPKDFRGSVGTNRCAIHYQNLGSIWDWTLTKDLDRFIRRSRSGEFSSASTYLALLMGKSLLLRAKLLQKVQVLGKYASLVGQPFMDDVGPRTGIDVTVRETGMSAIYVRRRSKCQITYWLVMSIKVHRISRPRDAQNGGRTHMSQKIDSKPTQRAYTDDLGLLQN